MNCLFCKIINDEISAEVVYQDTSVLAFRDINPQAPTHILIIPKQHIATINDIQRDDEALIGHMAFIARTIAEREKISNAGYRLIFNVNADGGQEVYHIHLHMLGGRKLTWPPG